MEFLPIRLFTILIWIGALIAFYMQVKAYPKEFRKERFWYSFALVSYIVHVLIFYASVIIISPEIGSSLFTTWSMILRIHGGFAILFKEIVSIIRTKLINGKTQ